MQSLPAFPAAAAVAPPTHSELAAALGFTEVAIPELTRRRATVDEDYWEDPDEETLREAARATGADAATRLDVAASRWEAKVREQDELRRCYDWSFERKLFRPSVAILEALQRQHELDQEDEEEEQQQGEPEEFYEVERELGA